MLHPDPHYINADPKPCFGVLTLRTTVPYLLLDHKQLTLLANEKYYFFPF